MSRLDKTPQPVREAIAVALMVGAVTATAASLLHEPLFLLGGLVLFGVFYFWRIAPQVRQAYDVQQEYDAKYADDETYQPILDRFSDVLPGAAQENSGGIGRRDRLNEQPEFGEAWVV